MYDLAWSSFGKSGEVSALVALIADYSVFSTCLSTEAAMYLFLFGSLLSLPFVSSFMLGFLSSHSRSSYFWYFDRVAYFGDCGIRYELLSF